MPPPRARPATPLVNRNKFWGWHMWSSEMLRAATREADPAKALQFLDRAAQYGLHAFAASVKPKERAGLHDAASCGEDALGHQLPILKLAMPARDGVRTVPKWDGTVIDA